MPSWTWMLAGLLLGTARAAPAMQSRYSSLAPADCRTVSMDQQSESSVQRCPGQGGYALLAEEGDLRQSVTVVAPGGRQSELNLWTNGFSSLGPRAEWRGRLVRGRFVPSALIVRLNVSEDPARPERTTPYLLVSRLTPGAVCVTARILVSATMNAQARAAADQASFQPCLKAP